MVIALATPQDDYFSDLSCQLDVVRPLQLSSFRHTCRDSAQPNERQHTCQRPALEWMDSVDGTTSQRIPQHCLGPHTLIDRHTICPILI